MADFKQIAMTFCRFVRNVIFKDYFYSRKNNYRKMGLFKSIFGSNEQQKEAKVLPWISLNELNQLDTIIKASKVKPQLIFKHSTRCGISKMVLNQFAKAYSLNEKNADLFYLDLLNYREISNEVGSKFQVMHQSPQIIIIKNGVVVAHASHGDINDLEVSSFI